MPGMQTRLGRDSNGVNVGVNDISGSIGYVNGVDSANGIRRGGNTTTNGKNCQRKGANGRLEIDLDALVVGAGFAGCYLLHKLRNAGFRAKIVEAGSELGGIWHWNKYPGARVDSQYPVYQYSLPEVYKDFRWSEEYPGQEELDRYFTHVDKMLHIKKDTIFNTKVEAADFDPNTNKWTISCDNGTSIRARFFIPAIGFAAKRHFPDWPGLEEGIFQGAIHHSSFWPSEGVDVKGKKIAVIGTGATGIQIAQTTARDAGELTVFQRTPNLCCPMKQAKIDQIRAEKDVENLPKIMDSRTKTYAGFLYQSQEFDTFSHTPEEREAFFEKTWEMGGFRFLANNYKDMLVDEVANMEAYNFWQKKIAARITDPVKRDLLAPKKPPHPFGGKRLSLEQDFYEQMNKPNVHIVDIKANPVKEVVPEGIVTADGKLHELDIIAIATGFDSITGGLKDIKIQGVTGELLSEKWRLGTWTYLGITSSGYPNFFYLYGPHGPTAFSNGPSCVEPQADWIVDLMKKMREQGLSSINADREAELEFKETVVKLHKRTLRDKVDGWYTGTNIPGKPREPLNFAGGLPLYVKMLRDSLDNDYRGFEVV